MQFIENGWYVAALSDQVSERPISRRILGKPIVVYRTETGVAALADRCPHRFAPLSMGKRVGNQIECPYHGLRFDAGGACVHNPHGDGKIPANAKVSRYSIVERQGLIWIWMGDPDQADMSTLPDLGEFLGNGAMTLIQGDLLLDAHYECVLDNLLDLSHAPYLHPTTLADPDSVEALRFTMKQEGSAVWAYHHAPSTQPSPQFRPFFDASEPLCDFHAHMQWTPPANLQLDVGVTRLGQPEAQGIYIHMAHLLTPIDRDQTRYTWIAARNFMLDDAGVSAAMKAQIEAAFSTEDAPMIRAVHGAMESSDLLELSPVLLPGDAAAVRVRRLLKQLRGEPG